MYHKIYDAKILNPIFRLGKTIPIAPAKENRELLEEAFEKIHEALAAGNLVVVFPEGALSRDGQIGEFKPGIEKIIARDPVPVIPVALCGFWDSLFSRKPGNLFTRFPGVLFRRVQIRIGEAIAPEQASCEVLHQKVSELRGDWS